MVCTKVFKTIIELVTIAEDKHEATDIAGEYLRGNISNGVSMRCSTYPVNNSNKNLSISIG